MEGVRVKCTGVFDETIAVTTTIPVIGIFFRKLHKKYHSMVHHKCHEKACHAEHVEHVQLPEEILVPNPSDRNILPMMQVDTSFEQLPTILLMFDRPLLETETFPSHSEFVWFISLDGKTLSARWKNKFFTWSGENWKRDMPHEQNTRDYCSGLDQEQEAHPGSSEQN